MAISRIQLKTLFNKKLGKNELLYVCTRVIRRPCFWGRLFWRLNEQIIFCSTFTLFITHMSCNLVKY